MLARIINKDKIEILDPSQFSTKAILQSGQVFRYKIFSDTEAEVFSGAKKAKLLTSPDKIEIYGDSDYFYNYFDLNTDYNKIKQGFTGLEFVQKILKASPEAGGIRILRGDFVEIVVSFILSACNNIKRFTKTIGELCSRFSLSDAFPTLSELKSLSVLDFRKMGCGYRDIYLVDTIKKLSLPEFQKESLKSLSDAELNKSLKTLPGVGQKVSACIMLFCFHRLNIVPIDTWIKRALAKLSDSDKKSLLASPYAGLIQQYMFYNRGK